MVKSPPTIRGAARSDRLLVVSQPHFCTPQLAIAAVRAGAIGLLDLSPREDRRRWIQGVKKLRHFAGGSDQWGIAWDLLGHDSYVLDRIADLPARPWPWLLLAGVDFGGAVAETVSRARRMARRILLEVYAPADALAAQTAGADGVILKGHEAGGRVGAHTALIFLQHVRGRLRIPYWIRGGISPVTAPAAVLAGATGVVLCEQLWCARESPLPVHETKRLESCDGSETVYLGDARRGYRLFNRCGRGTLQDLCDKKERGADWLGVLKQSLVSSPAGNDAEKTSALVPAGEDVAFASPLARRHVTTGAILSQFRAALADTIPKAAAQRVLTPGGALAQTLGAPCPVVQGPMTRVSDVVPFGQAVAAAGGVPFLALGMMRRAEIEPRLHAARERLGQAPWGVGILAFLPPTVLAEQLAAVREARPPLAILAGGRPDQAAQLEAAGTKAYVHVPSPGMLDAFLRQGLRRIVLEGRECGGHVGPRSSFTAWATATDVLMTAAVDDPCQLEILFAGGIRDGLSAAMAATVAAPLVERGMQVGLLVGTAYLGTREAVGTGAVTELFQQTILKCDETALLQSGLGHASRCARTPFVEKFEAEKRRLLAAGRSAADVRVNLELLNLGRLRLAAKGRRRSGPTAGPAGPLETVSADEQREQGMFMIGQAATLMHDPQTIADLHRDLCQGGQRVLDDAAVQARPRRRVRRSGRLRRGHEALAIVGLGCLFPECRNLDQYWQNILAGFNAVRPVPPARWDGELFFSRDRSDGDRCYAKWGTFLDAIPFDPLEYRIPPASLPSIEPIQLMALAVAGTALRDAGCLDRPAARARTGVIFAVSGPHNLGMAYGFRTMLRQYLAAADGLPEATREMVIRTLRQRLPVWNEDSLPGFLNNVVAGRISNHFDLGGPNFVVDAACAASLAALHVAATQLRARICDTALVGAADATNSPVEFMSFAKTFALSPRGRSCPFDDQADGIVLGEGVGAVVLKRLADAERDGDKIYAVVRGMGVASDGQHRSLTAPHLPGQVVTLKRAYRDAGVAPGSIELVEAHGTGTALGDRVELEALRNVLDKGRLEDGRSPVRRCAVGSVKSMIGHAKTAAGIAGLIKTCLALKHKVLPPTIGVETPNTRVDLSRSALYINTATRPWIHADKKQPRRAAVSAFGFGGTNFHAILEEYTGDYHPAMRVDLNARPAEIFVWRAADRAALVRNIEQLQSQLTDWSGDRIADLASCVFHEAAKTELITASTAPPCRLAIVARDRDDLRAKLATAAAGLAPDPLATWPNGIYYGASRPTRRREVCFLFPGQGAQQTDMLKDLLLLAPDGLELFARADRWLHSWLDRSLSSYIYPVPAFDAAQRAQQQGALDDTRVAQPALGVVSLFALDLLRQFGLRPGMAAGHSYGELVALHAAGCLTRRQVLELSAARGAIAHRSTQDKPGGMAAVYADQPTTSAALCELDLPVTVANINAPGQTVVAGPSSALEQVVQKLNARGLRAQRLAVTAAFHTPQLEPAAEALATRLAEEPIGRPRIPVYSNTTAQMFPDDAAGIARLVARQLAERVEFVQEIEQIHTAGATIFLEVGPGSRLTSLVRRILEDRPHTAVALDLTGRHGAEQLAHLLGTCWAAGLPVRLERWFAGRQLPRCPVSEWFMKEHTRHAPKPTDWIVDARRARPRTEAAVARPSSLLPVTVDETDRESLREAMRPEDVNPRGDAGERAEAQELVRVQGGNGKPTAVAVPAAMQFQTTMANWLALQHQREVTSQRFLDLHEKFLGYLASGEMPTADSPVSAPVSASSSPTPFRVPPAPVLPPIEPITDTEHQNDGDQTPTVLANTAPASALIPTQNAASGSPSAADPQEILEVHQFRKILVDVVSRRTGYPEESLKDDLLLETDLGIDSIKRIEIFAELKDYCTFMTHRGRSDEELLMTFTNLKTLKDIVDAFERERQEHCSGDANGDVPPADDAPSVSARRFALDISQHTSPATGDQAGGATSLALPEDRPAIDTAGIPAAASPPIEHFVVLPVERPLSATPAAARLVPPGRSALVVGALPGDPSDWRKLFAGDAVSMCHAMSGAATRRVADGRYVADFASPQSVAELHGLLQQDGIAIGALLSLLPLGNPFAETGPGQADAAVKLAGALLNLLKEFQQELCDGDQQHRPWLVNLTSFGGRFGIGDKPPFPLAQAVSLGIFKTVGREWPGIRSKNIDVPRHADSQWLVPRIAAELATGDDRPEIGLTPDARWALELIPAPPATDGRGTLDLDQDAVILATGGARGITAEAVKRLATTFGCRFVLVGRSAPPAEAPDEDRPTSVEPDNAADRGVNDQEIAANLRQIRRHAAVVEYHSVDVRDTDAFARTIDAIYDRHGRIDGVLHGAGIAEDQRIGDKSLKSLSDVLRTKIDGARVLAEKLRPESLRFLAFFSSVAARFGNPGQADYSAANEYLNKLADQLDATWPARVVAINWGPWDRGLVTPQLAAIWAALDIDVIPADLGTEALLAELRTHGRPSAEVVVGRSIRQMARHKLGSAE